MIHEEPNSQVFERFEDLGNLLEEVRVLLLLGCCTPLHVDVKQVREQCQADMERETAEENRHHGCPLEILNYGAEQCALASAVSDDGKSNATDQVEHNQK